MKTFLDREPDLIERGEAALRRGKLKQAWVIFAEAAAEATSKNHVARADAKMRDVERTMRASPRFMRHHAHARL